MEPRIPRQEQFPCIPMGWSYRLEWWFWILSSGPVTCNAAKSRRREVACDLLYSRVEPTSSEACDGPNVATGWGTILLVALQIPMKTKGRTMRKCSLILCSEFSASSIFRKRYASAINDCSFHPSSPETFASFKFPPTRGLCETPEHSYLCGELGLK
ncbi:hypothetical protein EX30DRAFT_114377 [Ascodesmis nigricans]|uniref:Uncharacterized protein n=1 Tax=Ascodesmis nigricans TaxID=341454 RepID=A0A4S2MSR4_9PEZI|nr:hypothetical protein EX30DRAFT_114377 [Ascodesmis nigricans]